MPTGYPRHVKLSPRLLPTLAAIVTVAVTVRLGVWQVSRYHQSQALSQSIHERFEQPPVERIEGSPEALAHRRATLTGRYLDAPAALSAGGLVGGTPGYRLVLPFQLTTGDTLLVDRGWVPVDIDADALAALRVDGEVTESGLLAAAEGRTDLQPEPLDGAERWPLDGDLLLGVLPRVLGPPYAAIAHARGVDHAIVLKVGSPRHEERLNPGDIPIDGYVLPLPKIHHRSYAAQWFAIAAVAALLWLWSSVRKA